MVYTIRDSRVGFWEPYAPRIFMRNRRKNGPLLEIGGHFRGSKGWDASMGWLSNFQLDTLYTTIGQELGI